MSARAREPDWERGLIFGAWFIGMFGQPDKKATLEKAIQRWFERHDGGEVDDKDLRERIIDKLWNRNFERGTFADH
jgi:hypothetical protein